MQVNSGDYPHITLSPFATAIGDLILEEFQSVQPQLSLWDLQRFPQMIRALIRDKHEISMGLVFANLLEYPQVVNVRSKVPP